MDSPEVRSYELTVRYPGQVTLDSLVLTAELATDPPRMLRAQVPTPARLLAASGETIEVALPADATDDFELDVQGWAGTEQLAFGRLRVEPDLGSGLIALDLLEECAEPPCTPQGDIDAGVLPDGGPEPDGSMDDGSVGDGSVGDGSMVPDAGPSSAVATQWHFAGVPSGVSAGSCTPIRLLRHDAAGRPSVENTQRTAQLSRLEGSTVNLFSDSDCATGTAEVYFPAGLSDRVIYVRGLAVETFTFVAESVGLTSGVLAAAIVPGPPAELQLPSGGTLTWGVCSVAQDLSVLDAHGNATVPTSTLALNVWSTSDVRISTDPACGTTESTVEIPPGASSTPLYLRPLVEGPFSVSVAATGWSPAAVSYASSAVCMNSCNSCGVGTCCRQVCQTDDCSLDCGNGCACQLDCGGGSGTCESTCSGGAVCAIDCDGVGNCEPVCRPNSECTVNCNRANNCDKVVCRSGASCLVECGSANNCSFDVCPSGPQSCAGGVIVCNRACP